MCVFFLCTEVDNIFVVICALSQGFEFINHAPLPPISVVSMVSLHIAIYDVVDI